MKPPFLGRLGFAAALVGIAAAAEAAIIAGTAVYAKRYETSLLSEPKALAHPSTKVSVGRKLKVDEVRGVWLRVSDGSASGWVFSGNVSETKPVEIKGLDGLPIEASATTATAAGRPMTEVASNYAGSRNLASARDDLHWLIEQARAISEDDLQRFLQEKKKGEFQ
jgi:hypothetical protein